MPQKTLKPCAKPGCPQLIREGRYCPEHDREREAAYNKNRGSSSQQGYGARWRRLRALYLATNPVCVDPFGVHGATVVQADTVDHILPKSRGGDDTWENLQSLCRSCHSRKTSAEGGRWG